MMKFVIMMMFFMFMVFFCQMYMFYYNVCFFISFIMIFMYMMKYWGMNMMGVSMWFGYDNYSFFLLMLTLWMIGLMFMSLEEEEKKKEKKIKLIMFIMMMIILSLFFMSMNLMWFYFFFEIVLIPTFFLVVYWGQNMERVSAAFYLFMYMLLFSLPLLNYIFLIFKDTGSLNLLMLEKYLNQSSLSMWSFIIILGVFLVKLPVFMFHIWLPKAHVEAPVYGSMVLAAILLKLGGYGLLRMLLILLKLSILYSYMIFSLGMVGSMVISILCLTQIDMKSLVAYSSVVHMNLMLCSLMTLFKMGFNGGYIMMISHGLCSSGLFYMVNLYYKWSFSRLLFLNKGMMKFFPFLSFWWFMLCVANFSFPFSLNFISEILMIGVILQWENFLIMYLMFISFFSSCYSLYLYSYIQHGDNFMCNKFMIVGLIKEFLVIIIHFFPLSMLLLNLIMFM